jgi:hypothetical protein
LIYKLSDNFFVEVLLFASAKQDLISTIISFKPYDIDDLFWDIVGLQENKKLPLSFRARGAFVLEGSEIFRFDSEILLDKPSESIKEILEITNKKVNKVLEKVKDIDSFISYVLQNKKPEEDWGEIDLLIVIYIRENNFKEALRLLFDAKKRRGMCRYGFGEKNFYDLAIEYCQKFTK